MSTKTESEKPQSAIVHWHTGWLMLENVTLTVQKVVDPLHQLVKQLYYKYPFLTKQPTEQC